MAAGKSDVSIKDILLLFICLELGAMVGIYFKTNHMPVRFLIYVAITALTRLLIGDIQSHHTPDWGIVMVAGAILPLAFANLVVRYGSARYSSAASSADRAGTRRAPGSSGLGPDQRPTPPRPAAGAISSPSRW